MKRYAMMAAAAVAWSGAASATTLIYDDFSSTAGLQLNGSPIPAAQATDGSGRKVLRLTSANYNQSGSAFSTSAITLADNYSFSTEFTFNFNNAGAGGADGMVFVVHTNTTDVGGYGGGIGYAGIPNSLGIEFDTWNNTVNNVRDANSDNHVGINLAGSMNSVQLSHVTEWQMDSGIDLTAWIDYNSSTKLLEVRLSNTDVRPVLARLSYEVDLGSVLGGSKQAYVGFTSGTGGAFANHDVVNWKFFDEYNPTGAVPEPATWAFMIIGFGAVGASMRMQRRRSAPLAA